eukprot:TRINITY_DN111340_c0_g1_i1.p1 TRINITY_DN111340_c0_g1~~TRINITY_DN111340_c0_g1_i1.p1  ORF type:complete len:1021 (+),score=166.85 TRINITY_DN111340_c0_g1_i1:119-3181(+)
MSTTKVQVVSAPRQTDKDAVDEDMPLPAVSAASAAEGADAKEADNGQAKPTELNVTADSPSPPLPSVADTSSRDEKVEQGDAGASLPYAGLAQGSSGIRAAWLADRIQALIGKGLAQHALVAGRRPWVSLIASACFVLISMSGVLLLETENKDDLFYPTMQYSSQAIERLQQEFQEDRILQVYAVADDATWNGRGMFLPGSLQRVGKEIDGIVVLKTADGLGWEDVCDRMELGTCRIQSIFHYLRDAALGAGLPFDVPEGVGEVEGLAAATETLCETQPLACFTSLQAVDGVLTAGLSRTASGAVATLSMRVFFSLDNMDDTNSGAFEQVVHDHLLGPDWMQVRSPREGFRIFDFSRYALNFEGARPASSEGHLMGMSFVLVLVFLCCAIAAPSGASSRILLGSTCLLVIILSLACALGLSGYAGVPMTSMTILMSFTLLGVAVDDIIVIVHTYDRLPGEPTLESVPERVALSLQSSGSAITLTTTTTFVGLISASVVDMPTVSFFCKSTALGIFAVYMLQLTLFVPLFILDEKRRCRGSADCCFWLCLKRRSPPAVVAGTTANEAGGSSPQTLPSRPLSQCSLVGKIATAPAVGGGCGVMQKLATMLSTNRIAQTSILVAFFAAVSVSTHLSLQISTESDLTSYYVDGSFIFDYFKTNRELYSAQGPYYLVMENINEGRMDTDERRELIEDFSRDLEATDFVSPGDNWLVAFDKYLIHNRSADATETLAEERARYQSDAVAYGARVQQFLEADAFVYNGTEFIRPWSSKRNVIIQNGILKRSRIMFMYEADFTSQARYIKNFWIAQRMLFPKGHECETYTRSVFCNSRIPGTYGLSTTISRAAERDDVMKELIFENLAFACLAVTLVIMLMLDPFVGLFVGVVVIAIDVLVLALLGVLGCTLDLVAFLCLCMTIGLTVDYSTHTVHTYMHSKGTPDERLHHTINSMGVSIVSGGGSTLLGIFVLAFASSEAFRSFFKVLGTAIGLGTLVGVLVSPLLMRMLHGAILLVFPGKPGPAASE